MLDPLPQRVPDQLRRMADEARERITDEGNWLRLNPYIGDMWVDVMIGLLTAAREMDRAFERRLLGF